MVVVVRLVDGDGSHKLGDGFLITTPTESKEGKREIGGGSNLQRRRERRLHLPHSVAGGFKEARDSGFMDGGSGDVLLRRALSLSPSLTVSFSLSLFSSSRRRRRRRRR
ncbi:hypothetical protein PIB30_029563 [Stylosanthes scabra]|uniref:Uncharacterized protein n=1 Tax=Stylosanthes scabra TaxID=79078 RepID=A0ABU6X901_9FABA|nr:hypothetical protein [Stylosanthes scabra]